MQMGVLSQSDCAQHSVDPALQTDFICPEAHFRQAGATAK
jgi:hypothetical protein